MGSLCVDDKRLSAAKLLSRRLDAIYRRRSREGLTTSMNGRAIATIDQCRRNGSNTSSGVRVPPWLPYHLQQPNSFLHTLFDLLKRKQHYSTPQAWHSNRGHRHDRKHEYDIWSTSVHLSFGWPTCGNALSTFFQPAPPPNEKKALKGATERSLLRPDDLARAYSQTQKANNQTSSHE